MDPSHKKSTPSITLEPLDHITNTRSIKTTKSNSFAESIKFEKNMNESRGNQKMFLMSMVSPSYSKGRQRADQKRETTATQKQMSQHASLTIDKSEQHPPTRSSMSGSFAATREGTTELVGPSNVTSPRQLLSKKGSVGGLEDAKFRSFYSNMSAGPEFRIGSAMSDVQANRLRHELKEREREIDHLRSRISELNKEVSNKNILNRSYLVMDHESQMSMNLGELEKEDPEKQKQVLYAIILKTYETFKLLKERCTNVSRIASLLEPGHINGVSEGDLIKVRSTLDDLVGTVVNASKTEIELGMKSREYEKRILELSKLRNDYARLTENYKHLYIENNELKKIKTELTNQVHQAEMRYDGARFENQELAKKVVMLEKRIGLILEVDYSAHNDEIRKALAELVKENEELKRKISIKTTEMKKQGDEMSKQKTKIHRQTRKIESLLKSKKGVSTTEEEKEKNAMENQTTNTDLNLLQQSNIPLTLDFRMSSLKYHYIEMLNDIMDQGANPFLNQLNSLPDGKDKNDILLFLINQLISYKEFCERMHTFLREVLEITKMKEIPEVMSFVNKYMRQTFTSEHVHLWLPDRATGIFYSIDSNKQEIRCLSTKGLISEVIMNKKPYNKRNMNANFVCEFTSSTGKYKTDNTLILPLKGPHEKLLGILEISNIVDSHFGFDEEYYAIALASLLTNVMQRINAEKAIENSNKVKNLLLDALVSLNQCTTLHKFAETVKYWCSIIFGVSTSKVLFVENGQFVTYNSEKDYKKYDVSMGLSGEAYKGKRGVIAPDVHRSKDFNNLVDLSSLMPVYFAPIKLKKSEEETEILGIFQVVIKNNKNKKEENPERSEEMLPHIGLDDSFEVMVEFFTNIMAISLSVFREKYYEVPDDSYTRNK